MYTSELLGTLREGKQVSKLTLANSQNASDFDKLRVREIYTSKRLLVRIIHVSQTCSRLLVAVRTTAKETKYLIPFSLKFQLVNWLCEISILICISDTASDISKEENLVVVSPSGCGKNLIGKTLQVY